MMTGNGQEQAIVRQVNTLFLAVDQRDWDGVMVCFAGQVLLDYRSMGGGEPSILSPPEIAAAWRGFLPGFTTTHHLVTGHRVTLGGDGADCTCQGRATHRLPTGSGSPLWVVGGTYHFHLKEFLGEWRIDRMKFLFLYAEGNPRLPELARDRLRTGMAKVTFPSGGLTVVGDLHLPPGMVPGEQRPALVCIGPMTGLKDQVAGVYARLLARAGFIALAFDPRHHGESEGEPRQLESPGRKVEDVSAAVTFLLTLPEVDPRRIGGVGICAGGGYMARAVAQEPRIAAFLSITGCFHDPARMRGWLGDEGFQALMDRGRAARIRWETHREVEYIPAVSSDPADMTAAMPTAEPFAYYGTKRGWSPYYVNRFAVMGYEEFLPFNAIDAAGMIRVPTAVIHGTRDLYCTPEGARQFYEGLTVPKEIHWIETTNHIDLYDQAAYVDQAVDLAVRWLRGQFGP